MRIAMQEGNDRTEVFGNIFHNADYSVKGYHPHVGFYTMAPALVEGKEIVAAIYGVVDNFGIYIRKLPLVKGVLKLKNLAVGFQKRGIGLLQKPGIFFCQLFINASQGKV